MQNFNSAELRPVEFARAYLQKKMLKKALREDAGADVNIVRQPMHSARLQKALHPFCKDHPSLRDEKPLIHSKRL